MFMNIVFPLSSTIFGLIKMLTYGYNNITIHNHLCRRAQSYNMFIYTDTHN